MTRWRPRYARATPCFWTDSPRSASATSAARQSPCARLSGRAKCGFGACLRSRATGWRHPGATTSCVCLAGTAGWRATRRAKDGRWPQAMEAPVPGTRTLRARVLSFAADVRACLNDGRTTEHLRSRACVRPLRMWLTRAHTPTHARHGITLPSQRVSYSRERRIALTGFQRPACSARAHRGQRGSSDMAPPARRKFWRDQGGGLVARRTAHLRPIAGVRACACMPARSARAHTS